MSPTHTTKNNWRYRYYISQAILQYREQEAGSAIRIPVPLIEEITTRQIKKLLKNSNQLLSVITLDQPSAMDQQAMIAR